MGKKIIASDWEEKADVVVNEKGSILTLRNIDANNAGDYKCEVAIEKEDRPTVYHKISILSKYSELQTCEHDLKIFRAPLT